MPVVTGSDSPTDDSEVRTGLERDIRMVEQRIDSTKAQLRRELKQLGLPASEPLTDVAINPQRFMRQGNAYAFHRARKARSKQTNLESLQQQLENLKERHERQLEALQDDE